MIRIETESDIERLRQGALLQQAELQRLSKRIVELTAALAKARGEDAILALQQELAFLREEMAARQRDLFGASSERRPRDQGPGEGDAPERTGHGRREQPELPLVEVVHVLDEADQACPRCGGDLKAWEGHFEDAEEIDAIERSYRIVRHRRQKSTCSCGECIETALGPRKLIAGGRYSVDFAIAVAYRQVRGSLAAGTAGEADGAGRAAHRHPDSLGPDP